MTGALTVVAGIPIPSSSPAFLAGVGLHVLLGLICAIAGMGAMFSPKCAGHHPRFGSVYYWCLCGLFVTAAGFAVVRWREDYPLLILGAAAFAGAHFARRARRKRWSGWRRLHIIGMGTSYISLLTAFYVDNGKNLPLWRNLSPIAFWCLPAAVGLPLILRALLRSPGILPVSVMRVAEEQGNRHPIRSHDIR